MNVNKITQDLVSIAQWHISQASKATKSGKRDLYNRIANKVYGVHVQNASKEIAFKHTMKLITDAVDLPELLGFDQIEEEGAEGLFDVMIIGGVIIQRCKSFSGYMKTVDILDIKIPMTQVLGVKKIEVQIEDENEE